MPREKNKEERFDEVFHIVLIVVALSFDILWNSDSGRFPMPEISVFIFTLTIWAYGNLKGGMVEYPMKIGSFNLALMLLTNFYVISIYGDLALVGLLERVVGALILPLVCLAISFIMAYYLRETLEKSTTFGILIGGTIGYMASISLLLMLV
ncbi:MAG: hypothetical protein RTU63_12665 [Candidatus Thorarchaeota archaeon]